MIEKNFEVVRTFKCFKFFLISMIKLSVKNQLRTARGFIFLTLSKSQSIPERNQGRTLKPKSWRTADCSCPDLALAQLAFTYMYS